MGLFVMVGCGRRGNQWMLKTLKKNIFSGSPVEIGGTQRTSRQHNIHSHPTPETMRCPEEEGAPTQTPGGFF